MSKCLKEFARQCQDNFDRAWLDRFGRFGRAVFRRRPNRLLKNRTTFPVRFHFVRTPDPPPFSSMNSTPADPKARRKAKSLAVRRAGDVDRSLCRQTLALRSARSRL